MKKHNSWKARNPQPRPKGASVLTIDARPEIEATARTVAELRELDRQLTIEDLVQKSGFTREEAEAYDAMWQAK